MANKQDRPQLSKEFRARATGRLAVTLMRSKPAQEIVKAKGAFWEAARERSGLGLRQAVELVGVDLETLIALETGHLDVADCPADFLPRLSAAIGDPSLLREFDRLFGTQFFELAREDRRFASADPNSE